MRPPISSLPSTDGRWAGAALVGLAALGFSAKGILIKLAYGSDPGLAPITLMTLRMGFALPLFLLVAAWTLRSAQACAQPPGPADWWLLIGVGLLGYYLASFLDFAGLQHISASLERLILFLYPTLVVILSALLHRRRISAREAGALGLSYAGIAVVFLPRATGGSAETTGALLVFASALSFALFMMGSGILVRRLGSVRFTAWSMTVAGVATLLHFSLTHELAALRLPAEVYGLALLMAIASTVVPAFLMAAGIRRLGASHASIVSAAGPAITLLLAWSILGETLSPLQWAGTVLILTGVWHIGRA